MNLRKTVVSVNQPPYLFFSKKHNTCSPRFSGPYQLRRIPAFQFHISEMDIMIGSVVTAWSKQMVVSSMCMGLRALHCVSCEFDIEGVHMERHDSSSQRSCY